MPAEGRSLCTFSKLSRLLAELVLQTFGRAFKLAKETVHSLDALAGQDFLQTVTFCPNKSWTKLVSKFHIGGHLGFFCLPRSHLEFYPVCSATPSCTILGVGQSRTQSLQAFWSAGQRREDSGDIKKIQFF